MEVNSPIIFGVGEVSDRSVTKIHTFDFNFFFNFFIIIVTYDITIYLLNFIFLL